MTDRTEQLHNLLSRLCYIAAPPAPDLSLMNRDAIKKEVRAIKLELGRAINLIDTMERQLGDADKLVDTLSGQVVLWRELAERAESVLDMPSMCACQDYGGPPCPECEKYDNLLADLRVAREGKG